MTPGTPDDANPRGGDPRGRAYIARWGYRQDAVAHRYHRRRYRRVGGLLRRAFVARAVRRALRRMPAPPGIILDFACGSGVATRALPGATGTIVGVDVSMPMLRLARSIVPAAGGATWVCGDIERPPFRPDTVAAVLCLRFFAHLPVARWSSVLEHLADLTTGPIIIGLPMRASSKHQWRAFKRRLGVPAKRRPIFRLAELRPILAEAGLELIGQLWQSPFTDTALVIVRRLDDGADLVQPSGEAPTASPTRQPST